MENLTKLQNRILASLKAHPECPYKLHREYLGRLNVSINQDVRSLKRLLDIRYIQIAEERSSYINHIFSITEEGLNYLKSIETRCEECKKLVKHRVKFRGKHLCSQCFCPELPPLQIEAFVYNSDKEYKSEISGESLQPEIYETARFYYPINKTSNM